jgi:archaeosine-15-forming tRNA-guanine transglycosylase
MPNPIPKIGQKSVAIWLDKAEAKALQSRASNADMSLSEYVADTMRKVADVEPHRVVVVLDIESRDHSGLRAFIANLLADDEDASVDSELLLHLESAVMMMAERARNRGRI